MKPFCDLKAIRFIVKILGQEYLHPISMDNLHDSFLSDRLESDLL